MARAGLGLAFVALAGFAPSVAAQAPIQLPPGAQPGATQPRDPTPGIPIPAQPFAFRIPPVLERPLGVDEGARVFVRAFEVRGILQDPNAPFLGSEARRIVEREFREALVLVEAQRIERQRLGEVGEDGFTAEERARILEFMNRQISGLSPEERLAEYQRFVDELNLARLERLQGLTIGQIQQVADAVTALYQDAGFFLARAIVPAQDVVDGVVVIQVLEGRMGRAIAENNRMYSDRMLVRPFDGLEGQLITVAAMEDALLTLSDYPGLQAFGTFRPGRAVGTADIVVNVQDERRFGLTTRADNHGTEFTGQYRLALVGDANNLIGRGDMLSLTAMRTFSPQNTTLGQLHYRLPLDDPRHRLLFDLSRNAFDITLTGADLAGVSDSAMLGFERAFTRGRQFNLYGQADLTRKQGESTQRGIFGLPDTVFARDDLAVFGLQVRWDRIIAAANALESAFIRMDRGMDGVFGVPTSDEATTPGVLDVPMSRAGADPAFIKFSAGYSRLKQVRQNHSLLVRVAGQWTNDLLTSLEQFSLGGPNQVRAAPVSTHLGDRGLFGSVEWILEISEGHSVSVFHDYSAAWLNEPLRPEEARVSVGGTGIGYSGRAWGFDYRIQRAWLTGGSARKLDPTDPLSIEDSGQTWVEIGYRF